jgi:hypothetical protein
MSFFNKKVVYLLKSNRLGFFLGSKKLEKRLRGYFKALILKILVSYNRPIQILSIDI